MSSPSQSLEGVETHEMKSDIQHSSVNHGDATLQSEDHDLSQFGYKPELEVRQDIIRNS